MKILLKKNGKIADFKIDGKKKGLAYRIFKKLLEDQDVQQFLQINRYQDVLWFNKEAFEMLIGWLFEIAVIDCTTNKGLSDEETAALMLERYKFVKTAIKLEEEANYQVERFIESVKSFD